MKDKHVGTQIKKFREIKGLTQHEFAELMGLTANYISAVERGIKSPSLYTLILIINSLGVSADEIFIDVIDHVYPIQSTILSDEIKLFPAEEQKRIFAVIQTMINEAKKVNSSN